MKRSLTARIFAFFAVLVLCCLSLNAQPSLKEQQNRRATLEKDIAILKKQLSNTTAKSTQAISNLNMIQAQKRNRQKLVREQEAMISSLDGQIGSLQKEINHQQTVLDTLQAHYNRLVLGAYKNRDVKIWYMYILSSDSISQAFRRFGYFKSLSTQIHDQALQIQDLQQRLGKKRNEMQDLRSEAKTLRDQRSAEVAKLSSDESRQKTIVAKLKKDSRSFQSSIKAKQKEMQALDKQIAKMLAQAQSSKKKKPIDYTLDSSFEKNKGKLPWPVEGPITEHFGPYKNISLNINLVSNGINIACDENSKIKSVFDGVVSNVMLAPGYGQCILIQHGSYYTSYCKVKTAYVHQGDKVKTGQIIGEVATISGKTQLYFLVWKKAYLDPESWLRPR